MHTETADTRKDKSIVVRSDFLYGRTVMMVRIDGQRDYNTEKLTKSSTKRLHKVLESIPTRQRQVELDDDFSPIVYLHWKAAVKNAGMYPAAHSRHVAEPECAKCGRLLDGDARCWHCDYSDRELEDVIDEDAPRFGQGGGNAAMSATIEMLGVEYDEYRRACDIAERIAAQAYIPAAHALELAKYLVAANCTASRVIAGGGFIAFDTVVSGVIFSRPDGTWTLYAGSMTAGRWYCRYAGTGSSAKSLRGQFAFEYREVALYEAAI